MYINVSIADFGILVVKGSNNMSVIMEVIEGLRILEKYPESGIDTGKDIIYAGPVNPWIVSAEDTELLEKYDWFISDFEKSWAIFI